MNAKIVPLAARPSAEAAAREWIVRIDAGPLSAAERARLQAWLAEDERHPRLLDTQALLWNAAAKATFPPTGRAAPSSTRRAAPWARGSAALLAGCTGLVIAAVLWFTPWRTGVQDAPPLTLSTAVGEHRPLALADGSQLHLNAASSVRVAFGKDRRRVLLDRGEGLFDVAKDATRPFEVVVGSSIVRAVGTRFLVRRQADGRPEVTVYEGVVELVKGVGERDGERADGQPAQVRPAEPALRLAAGQSAVEQDQGIVLLTVAAKTLEHKLAWQQDRIVFDDTPLSAAIEQVNRYSPLPLSLASATLNDVRVSGAFSTRDAAVFLRSLEQGFGLRVEPQAGGYLISRSASR